MKPWIAFSLLGLLPVAAEPPMRDATTHEELELRYRKAMQEEAMRKANAPAPQVDPAKKPAPAKPAEPAKPPTLLGQSDIICFNGVATIVPKRAILQSPQNLASRLQYQAGAKLVGWKDFYELNRAWITTVEVSEEQAQGDSPLAEDTQKKVVKSTQLVVATFKGGPISVLPLKTPPPEGNASAKSPQQTPSKP